MKHCKYLFFTLITLFPGVSAYSQDQPTRPNIVFIIADDLGWTDLSVMGSEYYETPNINRLATQGMMFTQAYANCANCAPTRAALFSGQYSPRTGIYTVASSARGKSSNRKLIPTKNNSILSANVITLAETLQQVGYRTGHFGKWHLGQDDNGTGPMNQGFDVNVAGNSSGYPKSYFSPYKNPQLPDGPDGEHLTDRLTNEAIRFLQDESDSPFFLYVPYYTVHSPIQAKLNLVEKYKAKPPTDQHRNPTYAAMIESLDANIGRLLAALDDLELTDNTMVIFTSDNGGNGNVTSQAPLRGAKGMFYEGGLRVPLIVRHPGYITPGSRSAEPVMTIDYYPTLVALADATLPNTPLDGENLLPILQGKTETLSRPLFWHFPAYLQASSRQDWPLASHALQCHSTWRSQTHRILRGWPAGVV